MTARHRAPGLPRILGRSKPRRRVGMAPNFWYTPYSREVSSGLIDSLAFLRRRFDAYAAAEMARPDGTPIAGTWYLDGTPITHHLSPTDADMWSRARADKDYDRAREWRSL